MRKVIVGNTAIKYRIKRIPSSRRLTINVTPGKVEVVAPKDAEEATISDFVHRRRRWIFTKRDEVEESAQKLLKTQPSRFVTGAKIPYRGRMMKLFVQAADVEALTASYDNGFFISIPKDTAVTDTQIKTTIETWMKKQLKRDCEIFIRKYTSKLNVTPEGLHIKEQKHLWGSLGKDRIININWHLIFAPKQLTQYVVAHEMCHLKHRSHSPAFWKLLRSVFSATDECRSWLHRNKEVWEMGV